MGESVSAVWLCGGVSLRCTPHSGANGRAALAVPGWGSQGAAAGAEADGGAGGLGGCNVGMTRNLLYDWPIKALKVNVWY
jgi:hypothetical protein